MGKEVEKKKKKGRPSLLDLQKRTLKEQQQQLQQQLKRNNSAASPDPNYRIANTPLRRSTRRNPNLDSVFPEKLHERNDDEDDEDELSTGKRREKKLKLVLKLPSQRSSLNSASSNSCGSDSNVEDDNVTSNNKKRKINATRDGSGPGDTDKGEKSISGINPSTIPQGIQLDSGPSTPLPDKKLLLFILDRLQKKDTYGVFSEPVDPNELPDYHEVIEHPMDFGTVRKKIDSGAYSNLEQFEKDVFLICSNAMQYNAPDTVYFRQARSIQELAKKNFENLRQDSDANEPEPRIVRRGRPPTKNLKKQSVRPSIERGSEFSSDATLATGGENATWSNYDLRKGPHVSQKSAIADLPGRSHVPRNNDFYNSWLQENKSEKIDDFTGSILRGNTMKYGKKQFVLDENRRNTYKQFHPSAGGRVPSVLTTFDGERKLLLPVGVHSEYGYARSLAQFAANQGPVAWKISSKKIERCLPSGIKFGPGWVGENDVPQRMPVPRSSLAPALPSSLHCFFGQSSLSASMPGSVELKNDKSSEKIEGNTLSENYAPSVHSPPDCHPTKSISPSFIPSSSSFVANKSSEHTAGKAESNGGLHSLMVCNLQSKNISATQPRVPFQIHPSLGPQPGMNGVNVPTHLGKLIGVTQPAGFNLHSSSMIDTLSRSSNNFTYAASANSLNSDDIKPPENSNISSSSSIANSRGGSLVIPIPGRHTSPSWEQYQKSISGLPPQQKPESVPPDLNVRFQAPGSPNSSRVDSTPDLALQL